MPNQREHSKLNWASGGQIEEINAGSLQRIADAVERSAAAGEKIAADYDKMRGERDMYRDWYRAGQHEKAILYKRISALQGVITKQRKKLAAK